MEDLEAELIAEGFVIGEGPRWHQSKLWFSDIFDAKIYSFHETEGLKVEVELDRPSGLGWLTDGSLLVAILAREDGEKLLGPARLARVDPSEISTFVELDEEQSSFNDMVTLPSGRSYLNLYTGAGSGQDEILVVEADGTWRSVASELFHPNGMAVTADGGTLIVSETHAARVTAFSIDGDGGLSAKRIIAADIPVPDGLCGDAEGAAWVGCLFASEFLRVTQGGEITHRVQVPAPYWALAATLGGADRRTLYLLAADTDPSRAQRNDSRGFLYSLQVYVPGAGWP